MPYRFKAQALEHDFQLSNQYSGKMIDNTQARHRHSNTNGSSRFDQLKTQSKESYEKASELENMLRGMTFQNKDFVGSISNGGIIRDQAIE